MFVYTFNSENVDQIDEVIEQVHAAGHKITFNVFSAPEGARSILKLRDTLKATRDKMIEAMERYPAPSSTRTTTPRSTRRRRAFAASSAVPIRAPSPKTVGRSASDAPSETTEPI
jgi:hypothetical protein